LKGSRELLHATVTLEKTNFPMNLTATRRRLATREEGGRGLMETAFPLALSSHWSDNAARLRDAEGAGKGRKRF